MTPLARLLHAALLIFWLLAVAYLIREWGCSNDATRIYL